MTIPTYKLTKGEGVIADDAHVPNDPANRDRQKIGILDAEELYSPAGAIVLPIADARAAAVAKVQQLADIERQKHAPPGETAQSWLILRYLEAKACLEDGTPTSGEYPLLAAEIPSLGADVSNVATAVVTLTNSVIEAWAPIEAVRAATVFALQSTTNQSQIDTILAAIEWPE